MSLQFTDLQLDLVITDPDVFPFVAVADAGGIGITKQCTFSTLAAYISNYLLTNNYSPISPGTVYPKDLSTGGPWWLSNGNVGINTQTPNVSLTIVGDLSTNGIYYANQLFGATSIATGSAGLVPAPLANQHNSTLTGDSKWTPLSALANIYTQTINTARGITASFTPSETRPYVISVTGNVRVQGIPFSGTWSGWNEWGWSSLIYTNVYMTDTVNIISDALPSACAIGSDVSDIRPGRPWVYGSNELYSMFTCIWNAILTKDVTYNFGLTTQSIGQAASTSIIVDPTYEAPFWTCM